MIPKLIVTAALMVGEMLLNASQKIKGPRLDDLSVSLADYGTPIPRFWGKRRLNPQTIWAEKLHEKKVTNKTKGGKYTEYKYYGTWAVLICDHEIDAVSRIWFDKKLVYDRTQPGPISLAHLLDSSRIKLSSGGNMRIYLGTETQDPDPRMETWCEDRYGANTCPAYRGSAYIVFEEIPLEQAGNRIPQLSVEVINNKSDSHPYEQKETGLGTTALQAMSGMGHWYIRYTNGSASHIEWWDTATRTNLGMTVQGVANSGTVNNVAQAIDGTAYFFGQHTVFPSAPSALWVIPPLGTVTRIDADQANFAGPTRVFDVSAGRKVFTAIVPGDTSSGAYLDYGVGVAGSGVARDFCLKEDGTIWGIFQPTGSSADITLTKVFPTLPAETFTFTGLVTRGSAGDPAFCHVAEYNHFFIVSDGKWYTVDDSLGTIKASGSYSGEVNNIPRHTPNTTSFWSNYNEISLEDGSTIQTVDPHDWVNEDSNGEKIYDPVNHAIWVHPQFNTHMTIRYLDRVDSPGVTLGTVVDDVSGWCGLTGQDTTDLTQTVLGYSVTQGSGKDMIAPLLDIHDVDARPHDFSVQFVNRGDSASGTLLTQDFVREGEDDRYKVTIQQDTDLPRDITFNFADWDHDQQPNNVKSPRPVAATSSNRSDTIDLSTYADTPDSAQQKADRFLRRVWNSRERTSLTLTAQNLALEPGDVKTVSLDGVTRTARLDKMTIAGGRLDCEWVRDDPSLAVLNNASGPPMDGRDPEIIFVPSMTRGFVLDIPYIQDSDSDINPTMYLAAGGIGDPWPGAFFYRGDDGTYDDQVAIFDTSLEATWGLTTDALDSSNVSPSMWDRGSSVNVKLYNGTLTTYTEAEIDADTTLNLAAIGTNGDYELIQFATATLEVDGTYTLSSLKRGRRGTEWAMSHSAQDEFLLVNQALIERFGTDDIGEALSFKATSAGRDVNTAQPIDLTLAANCFKPYAPARVKWYYDGTDLQGTIFRRTRIGGNWNGSTIPLSEDSESYEIDVYNGSTFKRTISATSTSFTYTAAMAATDGITLPTPPTINAYQLSATVGRGFALAA